MVVCVTAETVQVVIFETWCVTLCGCTANRWGKKSALFKIPSKTNLGFYIIAKRKSIIKAPHGKKMNGAAGTFFSLSSKLAQAETDETLGITQRFSIHANIFQIHPVVKWLRHKICTQALSFCSVTPPKASSKMYLPSSFISSPSFPHSPVPLSESLLHVYYLLSLLLPDAK